MKILAADALVAAFAIPASAATGPKPLTPRSARAAVKLQAEDTIGQLLYRSVGAAPLRVWGCTVSRYHGRCHVEIDGTSRCTYIGEVHRIGAGDMTWGENLRCD